MKIHNLRLGLATNSSSTHSIIWSSNVMGYSEDPPDWEDSYGWDYFTLTNDWSKSDYFASQLADYYFWDGVQDPPSKEDLMVLEQRTLELKTLISIFDLPDDWKPSSVDHQSVILSPKLIEMYLEGNAHVQIFLHQLAEWVKRDDVIVLGGNDNSDYSHPIYSNKGIRAGDIGNMIEWVAATLLEDKGRVRFDPDTNNWTVFRFDPEGNLKAKATFSFDPKSERIKKSKRPELADLKITDYCPYGCAFCYQGSTKNGVHASLDDIKRIASELSEAGCFEVAIGGGEPTLHPDFKEILSIFEKKNIVVNFTTRNKKFLEDPENFKLFSGNVAFSSESPDEVEKLFETAVKSWTNQRINIQYVMGSTDQDTFYKILRQAPRFDAITLLGYKTTGFGSSFTPHDYKDWQKTLHEAIKKMTSFNIGIDTALANESDLSDIPPHMYYREEGKFSFYIDAVKMTYAPSSFCPEVIDGVKMIKPLGNVFEAWEDTPVIRNNKIVE